MRRKLYFAAIAAVALAACDEKVIEEPVTESGLIRLNLSVPLVETRSEGTDDERKVNDLQVYLFDGAGALEAYDKVAGSEVSLECTPGAKQLVAFVNAPEINDIQKYDELKQKVSDLADNYRNSLVMAGEISKEVTESGDITIPVSRIAAKITLGTVTNAMALEYLKDKNFTINEMYLVNVAGTTGYLADKPVEFWYNPTRLGGSDDDHKVLRLATQVGMTSAKIEYGKTYQSGYSLYTYPNSTQTDNSDTEWSPRYTRLVLKAYLGNTLYYYPVSIPDIQRNTAYVVNVTITRPGSSSPDIPVDLEAASVNISIADWADGDEINEKI